MKQRILLAHSTALKLACYSALFFLVLCTALFWIANLALTHTIQRKQLKAITNKALEYRAWFAKGDLQQLDSRMSEQSLQAGDILFVRIVGPEVNYVKFTPADTENLPLQELREERPNTEDKQLTLGGKTWVTASVPIGETELILQAGKHSQALKDTLADFRKTSLLLLIPGAIASLVAGMALGHRFLAPTRRMAATMEDILERGDLSQRVTPEEKRSELTAMVELFNELLGRNQKLIEAMQDSLDHIAHDLRSPLSRIRMISERALLEKQQTSDYYRNAIEDSSEEVEYIEQLLTVLMDVAEAQSGALTLQKGDIEVAQLLVLVANLYELLAEEKKIRIDIACEPELHLQGDNVRLHQTLANLLDNAIKFSPPDSQILLEATSSEDRIVISVSDDGVGISEEDLPHIWDRLYRADRSRTERGMGLGLSLVKAIVQAHGGEITAESSLGKGSTFTLSLPRH
ncbi:MAG: ATP-binding protein [Verrucomicrobiota bacterium]